MANAPHGSRNGKPAAPEGYPLWRAHGFPGGNHWGSGQGSIVPEHPLPASPPLSEPYDAPRWVTAAVWMFVAATFLIGWLAAHQFWLKLSFRA